MILHRNVLVTELKSGLDSAMRYQGRAMKKDWDLGTVVIIGVARRKAKGSSRWPSPPEEERGPDTGLNRLFQRWLITFDATAPVFLPLFGRRDFERPDDAEADPLGIRVVPDAFWQLRILHFP